MNPEQAAALRAPFPPEAIGKLPKGGTTLDFVGHAAITDRFLQVDPEWNWEPFAYADDGAPLIRYGQKEASLWIRLTLCGVTRPGVGTVPLGAFELEKQLISDALRNAGMRFGCALDLWSRESFHTPEVAPFDPAVDADASLIEALKKRIDALDDDTRMTFAQWKNDQGFPWPWPVRACEQMNAELDRLGTVVAPDAPPEPPGDAHSPSPVEAGGEAPSGATPSRRAKKPVPDQRPAPDLLSDEDVF